MIAHLYQKLSIDTFSEICIYVGDDKLFCFRKFIKSIKDINPSTPPIAITILYFMVYSSMFHVFHCIMVAAKHQWLYLTFNLFNLYASRMVSNNLFCKLAMCGLSIKKLYKLFKFHIFFFSRAKVF